MTYSRPRRRIGAIATVFAGATVLAGALLVAGQAFAVDAKGSYSVRGIGSQSCESVVESAEKDPNAGVALASWLLGFMSAANRYEKDTFDLVPLTDARAVTSIAIALCRKNPQSRVESVVTDMLRAFARARVKSDSPVVEMKSGETTASTRMETLLAVQQGLNQRNLLKAKADGAYGPQTEAALKEYQKAEKIPVTGVADSATIVRMLIEQAQAPAAPKPAPKPAPAQPRR